MLETVYDVKRPPSPYQNPKYAKIKSKIDTNLVSRGRVQKRAQPKFVPTYDLAETFGQIETKQTLEAARTTIQQEDNSLG
jgi:hypothetical protein